MVRLLQFILLPTGITGLIARLIGSLSVLALVQFAFQHVLEVPSSAVFRTVLRIYDRLIGKVLGWLEPCIQQAVTWVFSHLDIALTLHPHWKHVTILVGIYLSRSVWISFGNNKGTGAFRLAESILLAPVAGILSGLVPLNNANWAQNFSVAFFPVFVLFLYGAINGVYMSLFRKSVEVKRRPHLNTRWKIFTGHARAAWRRTWQAIVILSLGITALMAFDAPSPGFLMAIVLVAVFAGYHMSEGRLQAVRDKRIYWQTDGARLGASMASVLAWNAVILAADSLLGRL